MAAFNHGTVSPGGVHAPSAAADVKGGVINILNINDGESSRKWDQIMSLAQQLTLGPDPQLQIAPVEAVKSLRGNHEHLGETALSANQDIVLESIKGNTMELSMEIDPKMARWVQLNVLRSPDAEGQTSITFYNFDRKLSVWYDTIALGLALGNRLSEGDGSGDPAVELAGMTVESMFLSTMNTDERPAFLEMSVADFNNDGRLGPKPVDYFSGFLASEITVSPNGRPMVRTSGASAVSKAEKTAFDGPTGMVRSDPACFGGKIFSLIRFASASGNKIVLA